MAKKAKTKRKTSKKKSPKEDLISTKSIVWALVFGIALSIGVILYLIHNS